MHRLSAALLLLTASSVIAQPRVTTTPLGPLVVDVDGMPKSLQPLHAAPLDDGFLLLARTDGAWYESAVVAVRLGLDGMPRDHRVLATGGEIIGTPTALHRFGDAVVFATLMSDDVQTVRVVALRGLAAETLIEMPTREPSSFEIDDGSGIGTTVTEARSFALAGIVPLTTNLFAVVGQTTTQTLDNYTEVIKTASVPVSRLVSVAGQTRDLPVPAVSGGEIGGAAAVSAGPGGLVTATWVAADSARADAVKLYFYDAALSPLDAVTVKTSLDDFGGLYPFGDGFLLYGATPPTATAGARLYLLHSGQPGARATTPTQLSATFGPGDPERFRPAFVGSLLAVGVVAVATIGRGAMSPEHVFVAFPGSDGQSAWETEAGSPAGTVVPLALHPSGILLSASQTAGGPWETELVRLGDVP